MRHLMLAPLLILAGCGEAIEDDHFQRPVEAERVAAAPVETEAAAVRVGELGPNFAACTVAGATRNLAEGQRLDVRAAPFDTAAVTGAIPAGARFFICTRSLDQRWSGVVWDADGVGADTLSDRCGLAAPVPSRRAYDGPCSSGWVANANVALVAG